MDNKKKRVSSNFGKMGWMMILYAAISYFLAVGLTNDGNNIFPEAIAGIRGWDPGRILSMSTIGGWIGIIGTALFSQLVSKKGTRYVAIIGMLACGVLIGLYGIVTNWPAFCLIIILINVFATGALNSAVPNTLITMWFPLKKGVAFGWATMGMPLCTAIFPQIMFALFGKVGPSKAFLIWGAVIIILGILTIFWVKDTPEEVGCSPDNEPMSQEQIEANRRAEKEHISEWTIPKLLKNKNVWLIGIGNGLHWLVTVGMVVQLVPRITMAGYSPNFGLNMMTFAAVVGIVGSYFWGWLDQKTSTRAASVAYGLFYVAALIFLILMENSLVFVVIATILAGIGIGGVANLLPSLIGTVFKRYDFPVATRVVFPINVFVRSFAFMIMGFSLTRYASYNFAYMLFIVFCVVGCICVFLVDKPIQQDD